MIGEPLFALQVDDILEKAEKLPVLERFRLLADWVLPSPDHPVVRLEGSFSPSFPPPGLSKLKSGAQTDDGARRRVRIQSGGEPRVPAIELVDTANVLGKLDELAKRIDTIKTPPDSDASGSGNERGKLALSALIQAVRGDDAAATKALDTLKTLDDPSWIDQPEWARWPELALTARAIERPSLRAAALSLLEGMIGQHEKKTSQETKAPVTPGPWENQLYHLRARATVLSAAEKQKTPGESRPIGDDPDDPTWVRVTPVTAESRGGGAPIPIWTSRDRELTHYTGHVRDLLYLSVPLTGEFQLDCELTSSPGREIQVGYGGLAIGPKADLKHLGAIAIRQVPGRADAEPTPGKAVRVVSIPTGRRCRSIDVVY